MASELTIREALRALVSGKKILASTPDQYDPKEESATFWFDDDVLCGQTAWELEAGRADRPLDIADMLQSLGSWGHWEIVKEGTNA